MTDRIRIFSRAGSLLVEFTAAAHRSWVMGDKGTCSITVASNQSYVIEDNFQFGNWVVVQSDILPDWVGTIGSREWSPRELTIAAFSPEFLLSQRLGPTEQQVNGSAGYIFSQIIQQANAQEPTILNVGTISEGKERQETLNPTKLSDDLKRVFTRSREEYQWRPEFGSNGNLKVYGDWFIRLGVDTEFSLYESPKGGNIESANRVLVEDAPDANYVLGYGNGMTWTSKPIGIAQDASSIAKYGMIQTSISYYGTTTSAAILTNALDELTTRKFPFGVFDINVLNVTDPRSNQTTFSYIRMGNSMYLRMSDVGFNSGVIGTDTRVRIMGMVYDPLKGQKIECALAIQR